MASTYGSIRKQTPGVTFATASGGSLTGSGTIYLSCVARNRQGWNLIGTISTISYTAGQKIVSTIASTAVATGEEIFEIIICGAASNSASAMVRLASWKRIENDQTTINSLPTTIELTRDTHIALSATVANLAALPTGSDRIEGQVRYVTSIAKYAKYDPDATAGLQASSPGYWVEYLPWSAASNGWTVYIGTDTTSAGGCDRPLQDTPTADVVAPPAYAVDGSDGYATKFLFQNGVDEDGLGSIPQGSKMSVLAELDGINVSERFSGKLFVTLLGYFRKSTGVLDTTPDGVGVSFPWIFKGDANASIVLPEDLPRGYGALYSISPKFRPDEVPGLTNNSVLRTLIYPLGVAGDYDPSIRVIGSCTLPDGNRMRVVPGLAGTLIRLDGAIAVKSAGSGFSTPVMGQASTGAMYSDTAFQKVTITATVAGVTRIRSPLETVTSVEAVRAIVGNANGTQTASSWTSAISVGSSGLISLTINYPCDVNGFGTIRANYPDVIASSALGKFNVPQIRVFIEFGGIIYEDTIVTVVPGASQAITIDSLTGLSTVASLPANADAAFGLFGYGTLSGTAGTGGGLASGSYRVAIAYHYPSGNSAVNKISHNPLDGCIPEFTATLADLSKGAEYAVLPISTIAALRALDSSTISSWKRFWVIECQRFVMFNPTLNGAECGNGVFKPNDKGASDYGRYVIEERF